MRIARVRIQRFRGFDSFEVVLNGHVLLVGEPRAGRTDLVSAIRFSLDPSPSRAVSEYDFHGLDLSQPVEIEVTLCHLSADLQQRFLDRLEFWDTEAATVLESAEDLQSRAHTVEPAIRIACRLEWNIDDEEAAAIRYWPARSSVAASQFDRVSRADREALPITYLTADRALNLAPRGGLRGFVQQRNREELEDALDELVEATEQAAAELAGRPAIAEALRDVLEPVRPMLALEGAAEEVLRFLPDGGSLAGLLRSLVPSLDLGEGIGHLPLFRHGSTAEAQLAAAEAIALARHDRGIVIVDDFADLLDSMSAQRLAQLLRRASDQVWLSTRRPETARGFESTDLVRLVRKRSATAPKRVVAHGRQPESRGERIASRELHRLILPAMTARALVLCEGPNDLAAFDTLAELADERALAVPPEALGVRLIDAGGADSVPRLARLGRSLGFRVVAILDFDNRPESEARLEAALADSDAVVRLPEGYAIERAIGDVSDEAALAALVVLDSQHNLSLDPGWDAATGAELKSHIIKALKSNNGLHSQFLRALDGELPVTATNALAEALRCAVSGADGHVQL